MALNQLTYHVKSVKTGHFNIVSGTTVNTNTDVTGTLNLITQLGSATPLSVSDKGQIKKIQISLNGNLATATAVRFFKSTSSTAPSASNTTFIHDMLVPVTTFAATTKYTPTFDDFEDGAFMIGPNEYLYCAIAGSFANGADVMVFLESFDMT